MWTIEEEQELQRLWAKKCAHMQEQWRNNLIGVNDHIPDWEGTYKYPADYIQPDYVKFWPGNTDWLKGVN